MFGRKKVAEESVLQELYPALFLKKGKGVM